MTDPTRQQAIEHMLNRINDTARRVTDGFPHYAEPETGEWTTSPAGDWTGGFWNGMLWLAYHATQDRRYHDWVSNWVERLRVRAGSETIFRGFLFYYGAALGAMLGDDDNAKQTAMAGAKGLAALYNSNARLISLGSEAEEAANVGRGETNIDGVQGMGLLMWAARQSGDAELHKKAVNHSLRHIELCVRDDSSVCQSASFDTETGNMLRRYTHKGYGDDSTWARAQAWAMVGYAVNAIWAPEISEFLETAERTADWWIDHVPEDRVAYWDFDAPVTAATKRDTSSTAIATAALLKLSKLAPSEEQRHKYREVAEETARVLVSDYLTPTHDGDMRVPGILTQGCYNHRIGLATEHELIWGDYYLLESLFALDGRIDETAF